MFLSTTPIINITKLFCELHGMLLLLPTTAILKGPPAAILEISVASAQRRGKLCHSISIQSTYFVRQLSVENVRVFIFVSVAPLYSSAGGCYNPGEVEIDVMLKLYLILTLNLDYCPQRQGFSILRN